MTPAMEAFLLFLSVITAMIAAVLCLPAISDLLALMRGRRARPSSGSVRQPRFVFLIPAHNEELLLPRAIASIQAMSYPRDLIQTVVIADNCRDRTAAIARELGAICLERTNERERGKPHALAWAIPQIPLDAITGVIVLDADGYVAPDFAARVAEFGVSRDTAAQCFNALANRYETVITRMAGVFNDIRAFLINQLKQRAGLNSPLGGNGMYLGAGVLQRVGWSAFSRSEDWEYYVMLTGRGVRIDNIPGAIAYAQEARSLRQSASQRERWAAGKLNVLSTRTLSAVLSPRLGLHQRLDIAAELTALGPTVTLALALSLAAVAWFLDMPAARWLTLAMIVPVARLCLYAVIAIARFDPSPWRTVAAFGFLPFYTLWRLVVQLRAMANVRSSNWVRTDRHIEGPAGKVPHFP